MGTQEVRGFRSAEERRAFTAALLDELEAFEIMWADGRFESGARRRLADGRPHISQREVRPPLLRPRPVVDDVAREALLPRTEHPEQHLLLHVDEHREVITAEWHFAAAITVEFRCNRF